MTKPLTLKGIETALINDILYTCEEVAERTAKGNCTSAYPTAVMYNVNGYVKKYLKQYRKVLKG